MNLAEKFIETDDTTWYWTDGEKVFFRHLEIKDADKQTFVHFPGSFAKDKRFCYMTDIKIRGADPKTFTVLNFTYAKDNKGVWTLGGIVKNADSSTFEVCDSGKYLLSSGNDFQLFAPHGHAKDKASVYYYDYQGKPKVVKNADPVSFISLDDGYFGYDKNSVFCAGKLIRGAVPNKWQKLSDQSFYSKSKNKIFYFNHEVKGADSETFELITNSKKMQAAKDNDHLYWNGNIISQQKFEELKIL